MNNLHGIAFWLMAIGGLVWGVYGLFGTDIIFSVLGDGLSRIAYIAIGAGAVYEIVTHKGKHS